MILRSLLAGAIFFWSFFSSAMVLVPAYNENYCPNIDDIIPIIRSSTNGVHLFESYRLMDIVNRWNASFLAAGDSVVANNSQALCVGLMNDGGSPNAVAIDHQFLLMGTSLLGLLEAQDGAASPVKQVKEKFVLAHEYAHILQNLHGLKFDYVLPMLSTKIKEQHADCMAAAMMTMNDEISDQHSIFLKLFIRNLADKHIVGDHGTAEQRLGAFDKGRGIGIVLKSLLNRRPETTSSAMLIKECGVYYAPTK